MWPGPVPPHISRPETGRRTRATGRQRSALAGSARQVGRQGKVLAALRLSAYSKQYGLVEIPHVQLRFEVAVLTGTSAVVYRPTHSHHASC